MYLHSFMLDPQNGMPFANAKCCASSGGGCGPDSSNPPCSVSCPTRNHFQPAVVKLRGLMSGVALKNEPVTGAYVSISIYIYV